MSERWQIVFYYEADGTAPVQEFFKSTCLNPGELAQLKKCFELLEADSLALLIEVSYIIEREDNLYELHLDITSNNYELRSRNTLNNLCIFLCALTSDRCLFLLHGFKKKSQRTPQREIKTATRRRDQLLAEKEGNK